MDLRFEVGGLRPDHPLARVPLCAALPGYQSHFCQDKQLIDFLVTSHHIRARVTPRAPSLGSSPLPASSSGSLSPCHYHLVYPHLSVRFLFSSVPCLAPSVATSLPFCHPGASLSLLLCFSGLYLRVSEWHLPLSTPPSPSW